MKSLTDTALKPTSFIPPGVALIIAGGWIGSQRQSIATLEQESELLRKHIADRSSGGDGDSPHPKNAPSGKPAKDKEPLDWKKIAAQFAEMQQSGGMGDMRTMMRFQQRLQAMSKEELVAALDEIAALDLPAESRVMLEQMLIRPPGKDRSQTLMKIYQKWPQSDDAGKQAAAGFAKEHGIK